MILTPTLTDGVVLLDGFMVADAAAHLAGRNQEQARRLGWPPARSTLETVTAAIVAWQRDWDAAGDRRIFAVRLLPGHELVGGCELRFYDGCAEVSYWIFPAFRGRGLATRALRLVASWAAGALEVKSLRLSISSNNYASLGVARSAGFVPCGECGEADGRMLLFERPLSTPSCLSG